MRIDDLMRENVIKTESGVRSNVQPNSGAVANIDGALTEPASDIDFSMPDMLQAFGRVISQRQELMDSLPTSVLGRLQEASDAGANNADIQQGLSGLVRENRNLTDAMRQIVTELGVVDRLLETQSQSPIDSKTLQAAVDSGLTSLQNLSIADKNPTAPAAVFATLVDKMLQTGKLGEEIPQWINAVGIVLEKTAQDATISPQLAKLMNSVEPQILLAAQATGQPDLVKVWAVVQGWGSGSSASLNAELSSDSATLRLSSNSAEEIKTVLQALAANSADTDFQQAMSSPSASLSRAGKFEFLLSNLAARPETLSRLLTQLPELTAATAAVFNSKNTGKATLAGLDKLANSVPKWLISLAEKEQNTGLVEFWTAAKAADLSPWMSLSQTERQQAASALKELMTTFEQPGLFRAPSEDSSAHALTLQVALYAPGQEKPYPTMIQIYEEKKDKGSSLSPEQEVWVRVSMETGHIGVVDLSFRLQNKKYLSIFSRFADQETASAFQSALPEIRRELSSTTFELKKISVSQSGAVGGSADG